MKYQYYFEKTDVWKNARSYVTHIYTITKSFPKEELYGLTDQLRRAAVSVSSNIAEGLSRKSAKDEIHFLEYSYASLMETLSQLYVAVDLQYLHEQDLDKIRDEIGKIANQLNSLTRSIKNRAEQSTNQLTDSPINQLP